LARGGSATPWSGGWLWVEKADQVVPPLGARQGKCKSSIHSMANPATPGIACPATEPALTLVPAPSQPIPALGKGGEAEVESACQDRDARGRSPATST
jgi:hypothetical protein